MSFCRPGDGFVSVVMVRNGSKSCDHNLGVPICWKRNVGCTFDVDRTKGIAMLEIVTRDRDS